MTLPPPVRRHLDAVLPRGLATPRSVRLAQHGSLRTTTSSSRWMSFSASHEAWPLDTAFAWDARIRAAPGVHLRVRDALRDGRGSGEVRLLGLRLAREADTPEMNAGSLHRFLAEAVWYPWALRPGERLRWQALDDRRALATLDACRRRTSRVSNGCVGTWRSTCRRDLPRCCTATSGSATCTLAPRANSR